MKTVASQLKGSLSRANYFNAGGLALLAALLLTACASTPKTRYYTLRTPPPPAAASARTHFILQVERFDAPDLLQDSRIIYYTSPTQLNFHEYDRWSSDPSDLLSEMAMKFFARTGLFQQVYAYPAPVNADYTLRGRVLDLDELKYNSDGSRNSSAARLGLKLDLLKSRQNKVIWSARLDQTEPIQGDNVQAAVAAMNIVAQRLLQNAYRGVSQAVEQEVGETHTQEKVQ